MNIPASIIAYLSSSGIALAQPFMNPPFLDMTMTAPVPQTSNFLADVLANILTIGGWNILAVSALITLIIALIKTSRQTNAMIWTRLGPAKVLVAPLLAIVTGVIGLGTGGVPITGALVFTYLTAGAGAVLLHEMLDALKDMPGIGKPYLALIALAEDLLSKKVKQKIEVVDVHTSDR